MPDMHDAFPPTAPAAAATPAAPNPTPPDGAPPLTAVLARASQTQKPVFLVFHAVWCAPCVQLENQALVDPRVVRALEGYVSQSYDLELGEGVAAAKQFGIRQVPAIVILSPKGDEVERIGEQDAATIAEELGAIHDAAVRAPIDLALVANEKDVRALLFSAKIYERTSRPEAAIPAYRAAVAVARRGASEADLAAEASFALLRLETRRLDEKSHSRALFAFASAYPASDEAIRALSTIAALPKPSYPDMPRLRVLATALIAAQKQTKNGYQLRLISALLQTLGDVEDAASASALARSFGAHEESPLPPPEPDPLAAECAAAAPSVPADVMERFERERQLGRSLIESCKDIARNTDEQYVRISVRDGKVSHAVLLDPEAPRELRQCLETAASRLTDLPKDFGQSHVLRCQFAPAHQN